MRNPAVSPRLRLAGITIEPPTKDIFTCSLSVSMVDPEAWEFIEHGVTPTFDNAFVALECDDGKWITNHPSLKDTVNDRNLTSGKFSAIINLSQYQLNGSDPHKWLDGRELRIYGQEQHGGPTTYTLMTSSQSPNLEFSLKRNPH